MLGLDLNQAIIYKYASLRYFKVGEYHISRICPDDVLLLVFDGVLRFSEDNVAYEIGPGQYHIQRRGSVQTGNLPSDSPQYLYIHFQAEWTESADALPRDGTFEYLAFKAAIEQMDHLSHTHAPYIVQAGKLYELLGMLYRKKPEDSLAHKIAKYIDRECHHTITLEMLCDKFHFSKNHIINVFRTNYQMTPIAYVNQKRLQKAEYLMEVTSDSMESISMQCSFQSYSHFYKQFVRKNGCAPERWREQKRNIHMR